MHDTAKYVLISIYISAIKGDINILYRILRKIYLIDNLKVYILLNNNVIDLKRIILNIL